MPKMKEDWYLARGVDPSNPEELKEFQRYNATYAGRKEADPTYVERLYACNSKWRENNLVKDREIKRVSKRRADLHNMFGMERYCAGFETIDRLIRTLSRNARAFLKAFHNEYPEQVLTGITVYDDECLTFHYSEADIRISPAAIVTIPACGKKLFCS